MYLLASNIETNLLVLLQSILYMQSNGKSVCAVDTEIKIIPSTNNTKVKLSFIIVLIFINYKTVDWDACKYSDVTCKYEDSEAMHQKGFIIYIEFER